MDFREAITRRMRELGVSSRALCFDLGFKTSNFSSYLHGRRCLPYEDMDLVMAYLGLTLSGRRLRDGLVEAVMSSGKKRKVIAAECDILPTSLSAYVTGRRPLSYSQTERLAEYFGLSLEPIRGFSFRSMYLEDKAAKKTARAEAAMPIVNGDVHHNVTQTV